MEEYHPKTYMTEELLEEILKEFEWPELYELEDDLPDGISVIFPECELYFVEFAEGQIEITFLADNIQTDYDVSIISAILALKEQKDYEKPKLIADDSPFASFEKVQNGIKDNCTLLQHYLLPCIQGDFSWVDEFKRQAQEQAQRNSN